MIRRVFLALLFATAALISGSTQSQEKLCDTSTENCRAPLVELIDDETAGIDIGVWVIKDARIPSALIRAARRGVPIRMIMDTRANASYAGHATFIADMAAAGIKMRRRTAGGIGHWNLMVLRQLQRGRDLRGVLVESVVALRSRSQREQDRLPVQRRRGDRESVSHAAHGRTAPRAAGVSRRLQVARPERQCQGRHAGRLASD